MALINCYRCIFFAMTVTLLLPVIFCHSAWAEAPALTEVTTVSTAAEPSASAVPQPTSAAETPQTAPSVETVTVPAPQASSDTAAGQPPESDTAASSTPSVDPTVTIPIPTAAQAPVTDPAAASSVDPAATPAQPPPPAHQIHVSNEFTATSNAVTGPGKSQSQLTEGVRSLNLFNTTCSGPIRGEWSYACVFGLKSTDDPTNDSKKTSITNLNFKVKNKDHLFNSGDSLQEISQYTLNTGLKGASYNFAREGSSLPEISIIYGLAYPRWDNIFDVGYGTNNVLERKVWGAKIRKEVSENLKVALNATGTLDRNQLTPTDQAYGHTYVYSTDLEYKPIPGLTIISETAFSQTRNALAAEASPINSSGYAQRIQATGDKDPSKVVLEFERVSPNFLTLVGSATPDREKTKATWAYKATDMVTTNITFIWFHDNIEGQKLVGTTHYFLPELGVTVAELLGRKTSALSLGYKVDYNERMNAMVKHDNIFTANYKDKFYFIDSETNIAYNAFKAGADSPGRTNEFTANTLLVSTFTVQLFEIAPMAQLGVFNSKNEMVGTEDRTYETSAGVGINIPTMKITSSFKGGKNRMLKEVGDSSAKSFATASINWKPEALAKFAKLEELVIYVKYSYNNMTFTTPGKDFREDSSTIGVNFQF